MNVVEKWSGVPGLGEGKREGLWRWRMYGAPWDLIAAVYLDGGLAGS